MRAIWSATRSPVEASVSRSCRNEAESIERAQVQAVQSVGQGEPAGRSFEIVTLENNKEIVVGAILPAELVLYEVPSSSYQYAVVNGATVLVEPASHKVVYIVR